MMGMSTRTISLYAYVCVSVLFPETLKQSSLGGKGGKLIKNGRKQKISIFLLPHSSGTLCLSRTQFSQTKEELEILACRKEPLQQQPWIPIDEVKTCSNPSNQKQVSFALAPILDLSGCGGGTQAMGCWDNLSSPVRECFIPSAKLSETMAVRERNPANRPMGPEREKGRAGQQPLLPPPQLGGESLLRLTPCIDDPGIWGWSTSYSFWNTFLLLPEKQFPPLLGTAGFFKAHRSWAGCF